ncbi:amino acid adenylation domain-containing protein [Pseudomonas sp. NPDC090202]|uniref:amino acid adenylation domain-containing protein n=1 Tax=unclassified Pseudomonas TaxID=196821 RepID=UPI00380AB1B3
MDRIAAARIARRFITLPLDKRRQFLDKMLAEGVSPANLPIPEVQSEYTDLPLSFAQERQFFLWQLDPNSVAYHIPSALRLRGPLDVPALQHAFNRLIARHQSLRTTFAQTDSGVYQRIAAEQTLQINIDELMQPDADVEAQIKAYVEQAVGELFDLQHGPLLRVKLLRIDHDEHVLVLTQHHIVSDGASMQVMVGELVELYAAACLNQPDALPELSIQYADYAIWQRHWMEAGERERQLTYWTRRLAGEQQVLELPLDRPRPATQSHRGASLEIELDGALNRVLKQLAQRENVTPFMLLLAAFQTLLHRYSRQNEISVGVPNANRNRVETERLLGFFVNTQVLRSSFDSQASFRDLLQQVRQHALDAQAHQDLPFEQLVEALHPERSLSYNPLFQVMYNHQSAGKAEATQGMPLQVEDLNWDNPTSQFDLTLNTFDSDDGLIASWTWATDLFEADTIQRMARHFHHLLQAIVADPTQRIGELPLQDAAEQQSHIRQWNPQPVERHCTGSLHQRIEAQAERTPEVIALTLGDEHLSYDQLNRRANRLAHRLIAEGVGPDVRVGLASERSLELIVGLLAILKAGGAYVPLDPSYPEDRLAFLMQDSGIGLLLAEDRVVGRLPVPEGVRVLSLSTQTCRSELARDKVSTSTTFVTSEILLSRASSLLQGEARPDTSVAQDNPPSRASALLRDDERNPNVEVDPQNLAYVIYTSGSTGQPKGALLTHHNVLRLFKSTEAWFDFGVDDVWSLFHSYAFDFSVWEIFGALLYGGRLVIVPHAVSRSTEDFYALLCEQGVTVLNQTPSAFKPLQQVACREQRAELALRYVVFGGEALEVQSLRPWLELFSGAHTARNTPQLINMYGITETTVHVTWRPITLADLQQDAASPIGAPIEDLSWYVLDSQLNPVPKGCIGELHVGHQGAAEAGLARGYHNRSDLTATRFIPDPFSSSGGRLYRTGDLARYRNDGSIEYVGRIDQQVKIRGFRIELGEIEARLLLHPAIREAAVLAVDGASGAQLVAYLVAAQADDAELRESIKTHLKARLPDYMVPAQLLFLDQLPLTGNGKLDRKALPAPDARQQQTTYRAPRTVFEQQVADIWCEVLKVERVGLGDNFFELGGHSLLATQIVSRLRQSLDVQVPLQTLFAHNTLQAFVEALDVKPATVSDIPLADRSQPLALSYAQERQWFLWQLDPLSSAYNIPTALRLRGALDIAALERSFNRLIARHETLRTTFTQVDDRSVQVIHAEQRLRIGRESLDQMDDEATRQLHIEAFIQRANRGLFDLEHGPLLRVKLLNVATDDHVLVLTQHHIVSDFWSMQVMVNELIALYAAETQNREPALPSMALQYADYAVWQRQWMEAGEREKQLAYWSAQLGDEQPVLELPLDRPRPAQRSYRGAHLDIELSSDTAAALKRLAQQHNVTPFMVLLASFQTLLHRYSGQSDIRVGVPIANRNRVETEGLIGFFVNTQVLKAEFSQRLSFSELLQQVRQTALDAQAHQDLPFEQLVDALQPERSLSHSPLFQVMYNHQNGAKGDRQPAKSLPGLSIEGLMTEDASAQFDLTLNTFESDTALAASFTYATDLFDAESIARMARHWQALLHSLIANAQQPVAELPVLDSAEQNTLINGWNDTATRYDLHTPVQRLIEAQVQATPDAVALIFGEQQLSYRQLNQRANALAHRLIALGVGPDVLVGIAVERSVEMVVGLLAILKAGGAYVPLDPEYPRERLAYMIEDSAIGLLLTQSHLQAQLPVPEHVQILSLSTHTCRSELARDNNVSANTDVTGDPPSRASEGLRNDVQPDTPVENAAPQHRRSELARDSNVSANTDVTGDPPSRASEGLQVDGNGGGASDEHNPNVEVDPENLAYVIYTSGSTGKPKGAGNRHNALVNRLHWMQQAYGLTAGDTVLQKTPFSFDVSVWEFFWPLMTGARLAVAAPGDHRDPAKLVELIRQHQVTTLHFVPSMLQAFLLDPDVASCTGLARIVCSGEALPVDAQQQVFAKLPNAGLFNLYGPTEAAIDVTHWTCRDEGRDAVPIGQPIANLRTYILDAELQPVPVGVIGELYLGGIGLARGYHRRPALTAERFVTSPFGDGERLYRTGDLASFRVDGVIDYRGRIDHQVKIRGLRIELGEIETRLMELDLVREAVVIAAAGPSGQQLVGYVVPGDSAVGMTHDELRNQLKTRLLANLADYMVPSQWLFLDRLPLSPNGKLDRKALPAPDFSQSSKAYEAPRSATEQALASIWQDVLKIERVGLTDNFFELGGDSIVSIQVVSRARLVGIGITPKDLFQHQTVQALATVARSGDAAQADQGLSVGSMPLLPIHRVFFYSDIPERQHWNQSVLLEPRQPLDAKVLEQALRAMVEHHDALRLTFSEHGGEWFADYRPLDTLQADWQQAPLLQRASGTLDDIDSFANQTQRSLDLSHGPLLRALLVDLQDGGQRLLLVIHHLAVDGVSWRILFEDMQAAYQQLQNRQPLHLPSKTSAIQAFAERLQDHARAGALQQELADWQQQLDGAPLDLPVDNPQGSWSNRHGRSLQTRLSKELTRQLLQDAPATYRTQINDLLLTALSRVITRWTGHASSLIEFEGHGREELFDGIDLTRTLGWFSSLYPVQLTPAADLGESVRQIKEQLRAVPNRGIGYGALRYLGDDQARQALSALPTPRLTFNYLGQFDNSFGASFDNDDDAAMFIPAHESTGQEQHPDAPLGNWLTLTGQVFGGELSLNWGYSEDLHRAETIQALADDLQQELAALIAHCCGSQQTGVTPSDFPLANLTQAQLDRLPVNPALIEDLYPLSPMQQGMLFHTLEAAEAALYVNQMAVPVQGLDSERFVAAWNSVIQRHEILRTGFWADNALSEPLQLVYRQAPLTARVLDWQDREVSADDLEALAAADCAEGFDLLTAPLTRLILVKLGEDRLHLIWTSHHILMDGWSNSRLLGEVFALYNGQLHAEKRGQYRDYIQWLSEQPSDHLQTFWQSKLRDLEGPTTLASSFAPRPDAHLQGHAALYLNWDTEQTGRLRERAQQLRVTANTLIQATWLLLLQRYTGQQSLCFGATVAGRPASLPGSEDMLGLFINTLPIIQSPQPQQRLADWLQQLQNYNLEVRDHEHASLADVQRWAGQGGQALFDSIIVFENYPVDERLQEAGQDRLHFGEVNNRDVTHFAMDLAIQLGDSLQIEFLYLRNRFTEAATAQIRRSFEQLLTAMLDNPEATLGSLNMLSTDEQAQLAARNRMQAAPATPKLLAEIIQHHAVERPDAAAVVCAERQLTYAELDACANRLAHHLIAQGVGPEVCVGIALERSVEVIVAFLAVMKAGGAYVPLDIDYPRERVKWIVEDSKMAVLLTQHSLRERFEDAGNATLIELDRLALSDLPTACPAARALGDNLAYLIYTSGSTGMPKGVAVSHEQIRMHCLAIAERYEMNADTCELLFMSFAFDGAQERWLSTLLSGARLVVRENRLWTPEETWHALHAHGISIACFPPAYLQQLAEFGESLAQEPPPVRIYCFGGDAVAEANFELVKRTLKPQYLTNGYGPTETVVTPLLWKVAADETCGAVYAPIGTRIGERTLYVLDEQLNPVPDGVAGELYIGGQGVARGYHQRPGLSAERFVADPFSSDGGRLYRTGDLVRQRTDGVIDYLGRLDNQVKIRGFRIELGEIESRLRACDEVQDAVVVARDTAGGKQLIGYVAAAMRSSLGERLRAVLQADLPDYMVPAQILVLDTLPLNPNGKIDRKALPDPDFKGRAFVAPRNAVEQTLAAIWQEVLEIERIGVTDNFFELGGDSLRVLKVLSKVRAQADLGIELKLRDMIGKPTIAELSGYEEASTRLDPLLLLNSAVSDQRPLFCLHAGFGTVFDYEPLARRLDGQRSVYGLQCRMLLDRQWDDESLEAMAIDYAQYIRHKQAHGPYQLLGWSLGGTLAVLVAAELEQQGQDVEFLGLVDSYMPSPGGADEALDWSADLRGFLAVMFGVEAAALPSFEVAAETSSAALEKLIDEVRGEFAQGSVFAQIGSEELAHTFRVAMRLKALSLQLESLPLTRQTPHCWWARESAGDEANSLASAQLNVQIAAGHYDMLKHPALLHGLIQALPYPEPVAG